MLDTRTTLQEEIAKNEKEIEFIDKQIQYADRNITGLIAQKTRHMDRRDLLEAKKAKLEAELVALPAKKEIAGD